MNTTIITSLDEVTPSSKTFVNPIIMSNHSSPDPWLTYHEGYYYYCTSWERGIYVWKSKTITEIDRGSKVKVWAAPFWGRYSKKVWAPELHFINNRWYVYLAASNRENRHHRMYVLESVSEDPQGEYIFKGQITDATNKWAIDGTVLAGADNSLYFIWSGWAGDCDGLQNLYIAPMSNPWTIGGERVLISTPTHKWESWINEGPQILTRNHKTFIVYSANRSWTADYCLGMLTNTDGDFLNPASWVKSEQPLFQKYHAEDGGVYSVGHCSFVTSPDGTEDWILYHGKAVNTEGWRGRRTRTQKFTWNEDDTPNFGMPVASNQWLDLPSGEALIWEQLHSRERELATLN